MKLVVGLGNPGQEYLYSRHNMGFQVADMLYNDCAVSQFKSDFKGEYAKAEIEQEMFYILKPLTYMNLSGEAVLAFSRYFKIDPEDILIVSDDMALEPGRFRLRDKGSSGGQKGLQNIFDLLGTDRIKRVRIGTGEPADKNVVDYVLGTPSKDESAKIKAAQQQALLAIKYYLAAGDFNKAMSRFNSKKICD